MAPDNEHTDPDTGPQGTRVFRRADVDKYLAERRAATGQDAASRSGASLTGVTDPFRGRRLDVPPGRSTLGRDMANDIVIDADSVSLVHARLVEKNGEWRVLNLLSTNGTWVNYRKVTDCALADGDKVSFGEAEFVFRVTRPGRRRGLLGLLRRLLGRRDRP